MRHMHRYEELFPDELYAEVERCPIVYLSFGPLEYHGPHGGLGMDLLKGYEICERAVDITGGIVYPVIPVAPKNKAMTRDQTRQKGYVSGSLFISGEVCRKLYEELMEALAEDIGFKVCVVMGSHMPATHLAQKIAEENPVSEKMRIIPAGSLTHNQDLVFQEYEKLGIKRINHGGAWESSMLMVSNPEFVDPQKLKTIPPGPVEKATIEKWGAHVLPTYEEISKVSVEFGELLVQKAAERIAAEASAALEEMRKS